MKPKTYSLCWQRIPEVTKNYSITTLKVCQLATNVVGFKLLLQKQDSDAVVGNSVLVYILLSKTEPPKLRIKRLL